MKRITTLTTLISLYSVVLLWAQNTIPTIPRSVGFAGMNIQLDEDARAVIQSDVKALLGNKKFWDAKLDRCVMFFPLIEGVLIDEDVPVDFKFLAVQESGLQPDAVSASNAVGFWQFKKETAVDYGLRVNDQVDERKNIISSTRAAAQYLKKSNIQFNNWIASLYSYYLGAGGISKTIPTEWAYAREVQLNGKSDRYILRFLAHKIAIESSIDRYQSPNTIALLEYPKASGRTLASIASEVEIDEVSLRTHNRWLTGNDIPSDKEYSLIIPVNNDQLSNTRSRLASLKTPNQRDNFTQKDIGFPILNRAQGYSSSLLLYEINGLPGIMADNSDNIESLARKAKVSFSSFLRYNDMSERDPIVPGSVYYLAKKNKKAAVPFHTVRDGESLWKVSQIYGIRLKNLVKYNRMDNRNQRPQTGRVLWLAKRRPKNTPVEVIEIPVEDEWRPGVNKSQPRMATQETFSTSTELPSNPPANNTNKIPQNSSERKVYTPKMADTPPSNDTKKSLPDSGDGVEITDVNSIPTNSSKSNTSANSTKPNRRAPSFNPNDDDKVVIINDEEEANRAKTANTRPAASNKNNTTASTTKPTTTTPPASSTATKPKTTATLPTPTSSGNAKAIVHVVEAGQTYFSISKMYDVTVNDVLYWNNLTLDSKLAVGQKLKISPVGNTISQQPIKEEFLTHTVAPKETMFSISQKYGVKIDDIKEWNGLSDNGVKIGQQLKIKKQ